MSKKPSKWQLENPAVRFYAPKEMVETLANEAAAASLSLGDYIKQVLSARNTIVARKVEILGVPTGVMCCFCHNTLPDHYIERVRAERDMPVIENDALPAHAAERQDPATAYLEDLRFRTPWARPDLGQFPNADPSTAATAPSPIPRFEVTSAASNDIPRGIEAIEGPIFNPRLDMKPHLPGCSCPEGVFCNPEYAKVMAARQGQVNSQTGVGGESAADESSPADGASEEQANVV